MLKRIVNRRQVNRVVVSSHYAVIFFRPRLANIYHEQPS